MDSHQYVDQYIRRKKGSVFASASIHDETHGHSSNSHLAAAAQNLILSATQRPQSQPPQQQSAAASSNASMAQQDRSMMEVQMEVVERSNRQVNNCLERTDALNLQLTTLEDKVVNVTKMVKLIQQLAEEREGEAQKENQDLRRYIQQLEGELQRQESEFKTFRTVVLPSMISDAMTQLRREVQEETALQLKRQRADIDEAVNESRKAIVSQAKEQAEIVANSKIASEGEKLARHVDRVKEAARQERDEFSKKLEESETTRIEHLKRIVEDRTQSSTSQLKDSVMSDVRACIRNSLEGLRSEIEEGHNRLFSDVRDMNSRLAATEQASGQTDTALADFLTSFRDHQRASEEKSSTSAKHFKEIMELQEQTRSIIATELEGTKQWAARNMQRLKKHLDLLSADVTALREAQGETSTSVSKIKKTQSDDQQRLLALLAQKSKEASLLSEMVDNEINEIQTITRQHKTGLEQHITANTSSTRHRAASANEEQEALDRFTRRANEKRRQTRALYEELSFPERAPQQAL